MGHLGDLVDEIDDAAAVVSDGARKVETARGNPGHGAPVAVSDDTGPLVAGDGVRRGLDVHHRVAPTELSHEVAAALDVFRRIAEFDSGLHAVEDGPARWDK